MGYSRDPTPVGSYMQDPPLEMTRMFEELEARLKLECDYFQAQMRSTLKGLSARLTALENASSQRGFELWEPPLQAVGTNPSTVKDTQPAADGFLDLDLLGRGPVHGLRGHSGLHEEHGLYTNGHGRSRAMFNLEEAVVHPRDDLHRCYSRDQQQPIVPPARGFETSSASRERTPEFPGQGFRPNSQGQNDAMPDERHNHVRSPHRANLHAGRQPPSAPPEDSDCDSAEASAKLATTRPRSKSPPDRIESIMPSGAQTLVAQTIYKPAPIAVTSSGSDCDDIPPTRALAPERPTRTARKVVDLGERGTDDLRDDATVPSSQQPRKHRWSLVPDKMITLGASHGVDKQDASWRADPLGLRGGGLGDARSESGNVAPLAPEGGPLSASSSLSSTSRFWQGWQPT